MGIVGRILQFGGKPLAAAAAQGVVAMIGLRAGTRLWIAAGVTDMRCDSGLAAKDDPAVSRSSH
jgi:hypothetical protein